mgnify:CR=1 FL=1
MTEHLVKASSADGIYTIMLARPAKRNAISDRLLAALVPALTVLMTLVVGAIMISVLLPIYDLTNSI